MEEALTMVRSVYQGGYKANEVDAKAVSEYANKFGEALEKGWNSAKTGIDFDSVDIGMQSALRNNIYQFSAAKNREELNQLNALLRDDKGKLRPWKEFKKEAAKVTTDFKARYMRTEYNMAVNSSYLSARWHEYEEDDMITYITAGDDRVRDEHEELDGITLPKSHPFWDTHYPLNGWGCRCTVMPSSSKRRTAEEDIPKHVEVPPMFQTNLAKEVRVFPEGHPYFLNKVEIKHKNPKIQEKEKAKSVRVKYLKLLEHNQNRNVTKSFGGQQIKIRFNEKYGLNHFINDVLVKTNRIAEKDLPKIHELVKESKPLPRTDLYKDRTDGIEKFYYLHDEKRRVIYQIAERPQFKSGGRVVIHRFIYGVVND